MTRRTLGGTIDAVITIERTSSGEAETRAIGAALAACLRPGDVVLLDGELGAGKTRLARAIAEALGVDPAAIGSPTFTVASEYAAAGATVVVHADAYRLAGDDEAELDLLGWDRLASGDAIVLVEWGERIAGLLEDRSPARVLLEHAGATARAVTISLPDAWAGRRGVGALRGETDGRGWTTCRVTGRPVPPESPTWPFFDERARMADLHGWFSESYTVTRPAEEADLEQGE